MSLRGGTDTVRHSTLGRPEQMTPWANRSVAEDEETPDLLLTGPDNWHLQPQAGHRLGCRT